MFVLAKIETIFAEDNFDNKTTEPASPHTKLLPPTTSERVFGSVGNPRSPSFHEVVNPMLSEVSLDTPEQKPHNTATVSFTNAGQGQTGPRVNSSSSAMPSGVSSSSSTTVTSDVNTTKSTTREADKHPFQRPVVTPVKSQGMASTPVTATNNNSKSSQIDKVSGLFLSVCGV